MVIPHKQPSLFQLEEFDIKDGITITGSREFAPADTNELFATALAGYVGKGRVWLLGGAIGIDQLATEWLVAKGEHVVAVLPFTVEEQPKTVLHTLAKVSRKIELNLNKTKKSYLDRNDYMVDRSDTVIAFWNGEKGGTASTVQYALKRHKQVHVYPLPK